MAVAYFYEMSEEEAEAMLEQFWVSRWTRERQ